MLLIDALNIVSSGGKVLLDYLEQQLKAKGIEYVILGNELIQPQSNTKKKSRFSFGGLSLRRKLLQENIERLKPTTVFCFGNFPMPQRFRGDYRVITFFQNALLLKSEGNHAFNLKEFLMLQIKKFYLKNNLKNTDYFIVQTSLIKKRFLQQYKVSSDRCIVLPFYDEEKLINFRNSNVPTRISGTFIYPSSHQPHKNHKHLLDAWEYLLSNDLTPRLYLTLPKIKGTEALFTKIESLNQRGAQIKNLGIVPSDVLFGWIQKCQYVVYPSLEETIGLSLVEGVILGAKILVSEKPYYQPVVKPSLTFAPDDPMDIAKHVQYALQNELPPSEVILHSKTPELLDFLTHKI
ncbi:MAG: glycosyltransferase [Bacteroidota bacterium]